MGRRRDQNAPARVGVRPSLTGPALIGEAIVAFVSEDEMVQQSDAEQVGALLESAGEHAIFLAWGDIARGVVVGTNPGSGIHQDQWFEHLAWMHDGQGQGPDRDDVDADDAVLGIQSTDQELFTVQSRKERPEDRRSGDRGGQR